MAEQFTVQALTGEELADAWPVVRSSGAYANMDWWISEASKLINRGGGVLVVRAGGDCIQGLAMFDGPPRFRGGVLQVCLLITFELSRSAPIRAALLAALERIACSRECAHIALPVTGQWGERQKRRWGTDLEFQAAFG